eukprot:6768151-Prymnesium_polylepis.1
MLYPTLVLTPSLRAERATPLAFEAAPARIRASARSDGIEGVSTQSQPAAALRCVPLCCTGHRVCRTWLLSRSPRVPHLDPWHATLSAKCYAGLDRSCRRAAAARKPVLTKSHIESVRGGLTVGHTPTASPSSSNHLDPMRQLSSAQLRSALSSALSFQLRSAQFSSVQLSSTQFSTVQHSSAQFSSVQLREF